MSTELPLCILVTTEGVVRIPGHLFDPMIMARMFDTIVWLQPPSFEQREMALAHMKTFPESERREMFAVEAEPWEVEITSLDIEPTKRGMRLGKEERTVRFKAFFVGGAGALLTMMCRVVANVKLRHVEAPNSQRCERSFDFAPPAFARGRYAQDDNNGGAR